MKGLSTLSLLSALFGMVITGSTMAGHADRGSRAVAGLVACGGNHAIRNKGDEFQLSVYVLRNYNSRLPIYIDRIRFFDSHGTMTHDFPGGALPVFFNGTLGPGDNVLEPHETAQLRSQDIFGLTGLPVNERPIQVLINWSADAPALIMETALVRQARQRQVSIDPDTGAEVVRVGKERSRHLYECRTIRRKFHK